MAIFWRMLWLPALVLAFVDANAEEQRADSGLLKAPAPTVFPAPGTYFNTTSISLRDEVPGAEIHYTWDGSEPSSRSPVFDPSGVLFIAGVYDGNKGLKTGYTLRAVAMKEGVAASEPATFVYTIERRDRTAYVSEEVTPGVRMIRDSDNDKMFLIRGRTRYALIDSGMGRGALRDYVAQFTGGLPLVTIWTHSHGDHIGQADQFIADSTEYVGTGDREAVAQFLERRGVSARVIAEHLKAVPDGARIALGDRALEIITVPGHTPGSLVVLDPASGNLFTGDSFGNNSPLPPDVMWMQFDPLPLDQFFAAVKTARIILAGRVKLILTGHNDRPLIGTRYLDNLETALQRALDQGTAALVPSYRPPGLQQIVVGDRFTDPDWFGMNVNTQTFLPAPPDQIASLALIEMKGATLTERFTPTVHDYHATTGGDGGTALIAPGGTALIAPARIAESVRTVDISVWPSSSRVQSVTIDGQAVRPGEWHAVAFSGQSRAVPIIVVARDGKSKETYHVTLAR